MARSSRSCARLSLEIRTRVLTGIHGAHDVKTPTAGRLPMLRIKVRRDQLARFGIKASEVLDAVGSLGGITVGTIFEDDSAESSRSPQPVAGSPCRRGTRCGSRLPEAWRSDAAPDRLDPRRGPHGTRCPSPLPRPRRDHGGGGPRQHRARQRPATGGGGRQRPRPRHRQLRRRGAGRDRQAREAAADRRLCHAVGRTVRAPPDGYPSADDRRAGGHAPDLPLALQHAPLDAAGVPDLHGGADGGHRRRLRAGDPRAAVLGVGEGVGFIAACSAWRCSTGWSGSAARSNTCGKDGVEPHELAAREAAVVRSARSS